MKFYLVFFLCLSQVHCARILGYFFFPSISHQYIFQAIMKELSIRGHNVTFITPNPLRDQSLRNLTEVDISEVYNIFKNVDVTSSGRQFSSIMKTAFNMLRLTDEIIDIEMSNNAVQEILKKPADSYDLILIEAHSLFSFALQHIFHAPLIAISSLSIPSFLQSPFGNPIHPVLYPDMMSEHIGPLNSIRDKIDSILVTSLWWLSHEFYQKPQTQMLVRKYLGNNAPQIRDFIENTSLVMLNINPVFSDRRPMAPNIISFYNIHLNRTETVPLDIKKILDKSTGGVVYFSLGTNVRFNRVQGDIKDTIIKALGKLPYTVLCKWQSEDYPGKPKNVVLKKWFPQQAILGHLNVRVFVTQGGLQSSEEAIINAVPMVVIPFLGDQPMNAKILTRHGMAETIYPTELAENTLTDTILKVATGEKYRSKAKELRQIFLDQPQSGLDTIVWWCEYVIRHKGAKHLRSPGGDIPLYEYFMLDILCVLSMAVLSLYVAMRIVFSSLKSVMKFMKEKKD